MEQKFVWCVFRASMIGPDSLFGVYATKEAANTAWRKESQRYSAQKFEGARPQFYVTRWLVEE